MAEEKQAAKIQAANRISFGRAVPARPGARLPSVKKSGGVHLIACNLAGLHTPKLTRLHLLESIGTVGVNGKLIRFTSKALTPTGAIVYDNVDT